MEDEEGLEAEANEAADADSGAEPVAGEIVQFAPAESDGASSAPSTPKEWLRSERDELLEAVRLNPALSVKRAPGPGAIHKMDWAPIAEKHLVDRKVVLHTDSAKSYKAKTRGVLHDCGVHCKKKQVRKGKVKCSAPQYVWVVTHKLPGSKTLKVKAGTQHIDRAWRFIKERIRRNQKIKAGTKAIRARIRGAQYEYWLRGCDLWLKTGELAKDAMSAFALVTAPQKRAGLLSGAEDGGIRFWDHGRVVHVLEGHKGAVYALEVNWEALQAVSGAEDSSKLWSLKLGGCIRTMSDTPEGCLSVAADWENQRAVSGCGDGSIRLWSMENAEQLQRVHAHRGGVWALQGNFKKHYLASAGDVAWQVMGWCLLQGVLRCSW
eukprot:Skav200462  [mRNA]  locus=scaffold5059:65825:76052:- [translate_table: standard]